MTKPIKIVFIGAGNVAWSLAPALDILPNVEVVQVVARSVESARTVTNRLSRAVASSSLMDIDTSADLYVIAVGDSQVGTVARQLSGINNGAIWVHTSGSVLLEVLSPLGDNIGVFYPMQTFSKGRQVDIRKVPFFIEGMRPEVAASLECLASQVSDSVSILSGDDRMVLHAAAVFACNFTNHLLAISSDILSSRGISLEVMKTLVEESVDKAFSSGPDNGQTGPARRGDISTINRHAELIGPPYSELYKTLSNSIINRFKDWSR